MSEIPRRHSHPYHAVERISQAVVQVRVTRAEHGFDTIRNCLLAWLREKAGQTLTPSMLRGETDSLDLLGAQRVETVALKSPTLWAARQDFQDVTVARRTWVTEAMLAQAEAQVFLLGFRLHCVTLGEPAPFSRSVPRFMRTVAKQFEIRLDGIETDLHAAPVSTDDDVDQLYRLLVDPNRRSPVIGIATDQPQDDQIQTLIDSDRLASAVVGTSHVRVLSRLASFRLTELIGRRLSVFNGAVRIWWPQLLPGKDDPYDHPLWLADRIRDDGDVSTRSTIAERVLRAAAGRRDADEAIPSFAEARQTASTILRENAIESGRSASELVPLYEAENEQLRLVVKETKADAEELRLIADDHFKTVSDDLEEARSEIYVLRTRLDEMRRALQRPGQKAAATIPTDFDNLEAWSALNLGGRVELLPRALKAARKSLFEDPSLAYQALLLLSDFYVPMRRGETPLGRDEWNGGLRQLNLECSPTHGGAGAGEFASDYFVSYGGKRVAIDMHLKGNNSRNPRYCFRLYFFWWEEDRHVVVASFPSHLETRIS